jgi:CRISPR-associated protein Cas2
MAKEHVYVFCYDVEMQKPRRRISEVLEQHGCRVQKSVFEVRCTQLKAEMLLLRLDRERMAGDNIRMYCMTEEGRQNCRSAGGAPPPEKTEFWLL